MSTIIQAITRRQKAILRRRGPIRTRLCRSFAEQIAALFDQKVISGQGVQGH